MKNVAVVILNWNGKSLLEKYLPSVVEYTNTEIATIYVADNASSDNSIEFLTTNYPQVQIIKLEENYGFAGGYNRALEKLKEKYFVLLNSDVAVAPNWIESTIAIMDKNPNIAAAQPKILSDRDRTSFEYAGASGGFIDYLGFPFCRGRVLSNIEKDNQQYNKITNVFWCSGAAMFVRADLYKRAGGLDEKYFAHMEEIDLCWRLNSMGYHLVCVPSSVVYHYGGATLGYDNPQKIYLNFRNSLLTLYKNLPEEKLESIMLQRMLLDGVAGIQFLLKLQLPSFKAVLKAHIDYYKMKSSYKIVRRETQAKAVVKECPMVMNKCMVWLYFIKRERKFSQFTKYFISRN